MFLFIALFVVVALSSVTPAFNQLSISGCSDDNDDDYNEEGDYNPDVVIKARDELRTAENEDKDLEREENDLLYERNVHIAEGVISLIPLLGTVVGIKQVIYDCKGDEDCIAEAIISAIPPPMLAKITAKGGLCCNGDG